VIKTPKGVYIRTKKGRIYAVHGGSQSSMSAGWTCEPMAVSSWPQSYSQTACTASAHDASAQCTDRLVMSSVSAGDMYSLGCVAQSSSTSSAPSVSVASSDMADDIYNINPMSFLNVATSCDGNVAWNSFVSDEVSGEGQAPLSSTLYQDSAMQQSYSCAADLPADLLCLDASSVSSTTDVSLPTLTVKDQQDDSSSLDSLTFDDCGTFVDNFSCVGPSSMGPFSMGPVFHLPVYSTHSNIGINATTTITTAAAAAAADNVLDIDNSDITDAAADWNELSALMNGID